MLNSSLINSCPYFHTGRTIVYYRRKRYRIRRLGRYTIRWRGRTKPLRVLKIYIRGRYRLMKRRGRWWQVYLRRRWCRLIRGRRWYYRYGRRWVIIRRVRLSARIVRRTYRIRPRGRKLYVRFGRRLRLIKTRFVRFINYRRRRLIVKRRGRRVVLLYRGKRSRPLKVKRFRE